MRRRPDVELKLPRAVHPGDDIEIGLDLHFGSATPVDFVELTFDARETATPNPGNVVLRETRAIAHATERLEGERVLGPGVHAYRARFAVPASAPPSYVGTTLETSYEIALHVSIPWWPDLRERYVVRVEPRPVRRPPVVAASATTDRGAGPFAELSIDDPALAVGDSVTGAFALGNARERRVRAVELSLVGFEHAIVRGKRRVLEAHRFVVSHALRGAYEGREVPFSFRVPRGTAPSFESGLGRLEWVVEIRVDLDGAPGVRCRVPVTIGAFGAREPGAARRPEIGIARWRGVWAEAGLAHMLALDPTELRLAGDMGGCEVSVRFDASDARSPALAGELSWAPWGIGLELSERRVLLFPSSLELRAGSRFRIRSREAEQAEAALALELFEALEAFHEVWIEDGRATVRSREAGYDRPFIERFLADLARLARQIDAAGERIPPPSAMAAFLPAWRAFASQVGGRFYPGGMIIRDARHEGGRFTIETVFGEDPAPSGARIALAIEPPLARAPSLGEEAAAAQLPSGTRAIVDELSADGRVLHVETSRMTLLLPEPPADPATLRPLLGAMLGLAERLRTERGPGPYR